MSQADRILRLVLTGSEASGKSTLARRLAAHLDVPTSDEFARTYAERARRPLTAADVEPIARGQITAEAAAEQHARDTSAGIIVLDTDLVSTVVYATHYYGACPGWIVDAARARLGDLYLLLAPDLPWTPDGIRDRPDQRAELHDAFRTWLRRFDAHVAEIQGTGEERVSKSLHAITKGIPRNSPPGS